MKRKISGDSSSKQSKSSAMTSIGPLFENKFRIEGVAADNLYVIRESIRIATRVGISPGHRLAALWLDNPRRFFKSLNLHRSGADKISSEERACGWFSPPTPIIQSWAQTSSTGWRTRNIDAAESSNSPFR